MSAFNQIQLQEFREATPPEVHCPDTGESLVHNFAIHHLDANVRAHSKSVNGCQQTGADIMLTFGSQIAVLGNNKPIRLETLKHVDVFLNEKQARNLVRELQEALNRNDSPAYPALCGSTLGMHSALL